MPAIQNFVGYDRAATPAAHTFSPFSRDDKGVFEFREAGATPLADKVLTVSHRKTATGKYQTKLRLAVPVVANSTVNGVTVPVVVRTAYMESTMTFDPTSTVQERKDFENIFSDLMVLANNAWFVDGVIANNGGMY